ncbi:AAA family ATPase, partial [Erwinia amylovora]
MKVISFLNPKGGSGKTTAVINVSAAMARAGYNIA